MQMQPSSPRSASSGDYSRNADSSSLASSSASAADAFLSDSFSQDASEPKDPARAFDRAMTFLLAAILLFLLVARFTLLRPSPEPASPALLSDPRPRAAALP